VSAAETLYSARIPYADVVERGRQQVVALEVYRSGSLVAPTEAGSSLTIYKPDNTKLVDAGAVTVTGSIAQRTLTSVVLADSLDLGDGYLQEWTLVLDGVPRTFRREMAVARRALFPVIADADLTDDYPDLLVQIAGISTTVQGFIDAAWKRIQRKLIAKGVHTYLVVSAASFADWHRELALYLTFKALFRATPSDRHRDLMAHHLNEAKLAAAELNFTEDADHDGRADSQNRVSASGPIFPNAAPRGRRRPTNRW
jgi:hypothetical protein